MFLPLVIKSIGHDFVVFKCIDFRKVDDFDLFNNRITSILKVLIMQIYVLNNEEMKTIMNILIMIISDTSKDSFICCKFSFY